MWACRARFPLAHAIVECIRAELRTDLTVLARLERVAIRPAANRAGSVHANSICDRHVFATAHRSTDAAADCEADSSSDASADREAYPHPIAGEQVDRAWLTDP